MSDERLRELEKRLRTSGSVEDEAALLRARVQAGDLSQEQVELAAFVDHKPARLALGTGAPTAPWDIRGWIDGLQAWGADAYYWPATPPYSLAPQITVWVPASCPTPCPRVGMGQLASQPLRLEEPTQRLLVLRDAQDDSALRPQANAALAEWALGAECPQGTLDFARVAGRKPLYLALVVSSIEAEGLTCRVFPSDFYSGWDVPVWEAGRTAVGGFTICGNGSYNPSPLRASPRLMEISQAIVSHLGGLGFRAAEERGEL